MRSDVMKFFILSALFVLILVTFSTMVHHLITEVVPLPESQLLTYGSHMRADLG